MYPLIGVTAYQTTNHEGLPVNALLRAYLDAVLQAGGTPVVIPVNLPADRVPNLYDRLDGILFSGGGDIENTHFHGESHPRISDVDPERDLIELSILDTFISGKKPILGICRGLQIINVGMGGTLYTHIIDQMPEAQQHDFSSGFPRNFIAHYVTIKSGTRLASILGEANLPVNSLHHQGIKDIPVGLEPSAFSPDGLVEAIELKDHPYGIAVQWHPEWLMDQELIQKLFRSFIAAAGTMR